MKHNLKVISAVVVVSFSLQLVMPINLWADGPLVTTQNNTKIMSEGTGVDPNNVLQNKENVNSLISSNIEILPSENTSYGFRITASLDPKAGSNVVSLMVKDGEALFIDGSGREIVGVYDKEKKQASFVVPVFEMNTVETFVVDVEVGLADQAKISKITHTVVWTLTINGQGKNEITTFTLDSNSRLREYHRESNLGIKSDKVDLVLILTNGWPNWSVATSSEDKAAKTIQYTQVQALTETQVSGFTVVKTIASQQEKIMNLAKISSFQDFSSLLKSVERVKAINGAFEDRLSLVTTPSGLQNFIVLGRADWMNEQITSDPADIYFIQDQKINLSSSGGGCEVKVEPTSGCEGTPEEIYTISFGARKDAYGAVMSYGLQFKDKYGNITVVDYPKTDTVKLNGVTYKINIKDGKVSLKRHIPDFVTAYVDKVKNGLPEGFLVLLGFDPANKIDGYYVLHVFDARYQTQVVDGRFVSAQLKFYLSAPNVEPYLNPQSPSAFAFQGFPRLDANMLWYGVQQLAQKINPNQYYMNGINMIRILSEIKITAVDENKTIHFTHQGNKWKIENGRLIEDYKQVTIPVGSKVPSVDVVTNTITIGDNKIRIPQNTMIYLSDYKNSYQTLVSMAQLADKLNAAIADDSSMSTIVSLTAVDKEGLVLADPYLRLTLDYERINIAPNQPIQSVDVANRSIVIGNDTLLLPSTLTITNYDKYPPTVITLQEFANMIQQAQAEGGSVQMNNYLDVLKSATKNRIQTPAFYVRTVFQTSVIPSNSPVESVDAVARTIKINGEDYYFPMTLNPIYVMNNSGGTSYISDLNTLKMMIAQAVADGASVSLAYNMTVIHKKSGKVFQSNFSLGINIKYELSILPVKTALEAVDASLRTMKFNGEDYMVPSATSIYLDGVAVSMNHLMAAMQAASLDEAKLELTSQLNAAKTASGKKITSPYIYFKTAYKSYDMPAGSLVTEIRQDTNEIKIDKIGIFVDPSVRLYFQTETGAIQTVTLNDLQVRMQAAQADGVELVLSNTGMAIFKGGHYVFQNPYVYFKANYPTIQIPVNTQLSEVNVATRTLKLGAESIILPTTCAIYVDNTRFLSVDHLAAILAQATLDEAPVTLTNSYTAVKTKDGNRLVGSLISLKVNYKTASVAMGAVVENVSVADRTIRIGNTEIKLNSSNVINLMGENNLMQVVTLDQLVVMIAKAKNEGVNTVNNYPLTLIFKNGGYQLRDSSLFLKLNYIRGSVASESPLSAVDLASSTLTFNGKTYQVDPKSYLTVDNKPVTFAVLADILNASIAAGKKVVLASTIYTSETQLSKKITTTNIYFITR